MDEHVVRVEQVQSLSMIPTGNEVSGHKVVMEYKDDDRRFVVEVSIERFTEAFRHILYQLPLTARRDVLDKLNEREFRP